MHAREKLGSIGNTPERANLFGDTWILVSERPVRIGIGVLVTLWISWRHLLVPALVLDFVPPAMSALQFWREISAVACCQLGF